MKQYMKLLPVLALGMVVESCVDDALLPYSVQKPTSVAQYEYLNNYDVLKSYLDRAKNPNFKLGLAASVSDFVQQGVVYEAVTTNFDEMTAGNAMKYASVVADDGTMNFSTVSNFVDVAKAAGITIYGHTLGWHAQQNMTYLNGLIASTVVPADPSTVNHYLLLHQDTKANPWDGQVYYALDNTLSKGKEYTLSFRAKASESFNFQLWVMRASGADVTVDGGTSIATDWTDYSFKFTPADDDWNTIKFVSGELAGDFCVDDLKLVEAGSEKNLVANGDFEKDNLNGWTKYSWHAITYMIQADAAGGSGGGYCLNMTNSAPGTDVWSAQVWYNLSEPLKAGVEYSFTCMAKATDALNIPIYLQSTTSGNQGYLPELVVSKEWNKSTVTFTPSEAIFDKFTFNFGTFNGTISIDNVELKEVGSDVNLMVNSDFEAGNINGWQSWNGYESLSALGEGYNPGDQVIEMTPEEKKDTLTWALDNWVKGMMEATGGYVTAWDLANETVSGTDSDGDGIYELQSSENGDPTTNFYWTDYLGDIDYVRILESRARKYFKEYGGDPSKLKLFINDFNLESWWDGNKKAKSLVEWIKRWESDGVTKIDGIGTQMHVSYILNEANQKAQEDAIVNMFKILAASGKLIKISELDMGIVDKAFGTAIKTENVTYEQQLKMAEFYQFIISKYFEIIPVEQQYGITQWCATDSPADSGWRPGEPTGLWDSSFKRKPTYAGFANGLAGKVIAEPSEELSQEK